MKNKRLKLTWAKFFTAIFGSSLVGLTFGFLVFHQFMFKGLGNLRFEVLFFAFIVGLIGMILMFFGFKTKEKLKAH